MTPQRSRSNTTQARREPRIIQNVPPDIQLIYTNTIFTQTSVFDFTMLLGVIRSASPEETVIDYLAKVAMSPQHAKALAQQLTEHVSRYEEAFGPLVIEPRNPEANLAYAIETPPPA